MPDSNDTPRTDRDISAAIADATRPTALVGQMPPAFDDTATIGGRRGRQDLVGRAPGAPDIASPTETVHLHRGEIWGGDFELGPLIGRGGMGAVYAARQLSLERAVALKALRGHLSDDPELVARFEQEAKWLARINSPHVIQVHAFGKHRNHHFLVMELIEGEDVGKKLKGGWRPTHAEAVELIAQAARGLIAAGEHGIVHRDIKPGNMMLTTRGVLKLTDFGLARLVHGSGSNISSTGVILGTDAYMSPEQCQGRAVDQRSDIYSLGVVFYELLCGRRPFSGETHMEVFCQHLERMPTAPRELDPTIPPEIEAVALQMLAKDPQARYQNGAELLADLERILAQEKPLARPPRRGHGKLIVALLLALGALGIALWLWWDQRQPEILPAPAPAPTAEKPQPQPPHIPVAVAQELQPISAPKRDAPPAPPPENSLAAEVAAQDAERLKLGRRFEELHSRAAGPTPALKLRHDWAGFLTEAAKDPSAAELSAKADTEWRKLAWTEQVTRPSWATAFDHDDYGSYADVDCAGYQQRFRYCPKGEYDRGSPESSGFHRPDERMQHVAITTGFWIAETEVTRLQWAAVYDERVDSPLPTPKTNVTWNEAQAFCATLRERGVPARLPTEAEWEYACRAGYDLAPAALPEFGWTSATEPRVQSVHLKRPNAWGICDMHGNAAEWCSDWYAPLYPEAEEQDPQGPSSGEERVYRGGSVGMGEPDCRAASRFHGRPGVSLDTIGFRVIVRE